MPQAVLIIKGKKIYIDGDFEDSQGGKIAANRAVEYKIDQLYEEDERNSCYDVRYQGIKNGVHTFTCGVGGGKRLRKSFKKSSKKSFKKSSKKSFKKSFKKSRKLRRR